MSSVASTRRTNRRLTARRACQLQVAYRTGKQWHPATAMDISKNGCRLRLGEELQRDVPVTVLVSHANAEGKTLSTEIEGAVIWWRQEGLSSQAGIHFKSESSVLVDIMTALF